MSLSGDSWNGRYMGLSTARNIEGPAACAAPPILMTSWNNSNRGTPGYASSAQWGTFPGAPATDGWYHIQLEMKSGPAGSAYLKNWGNSNDYARPTSQQFPLRNNLGQTMGLGVTGWPGASLGAYMDNPAPTTLSYIVDDFEIGRSFDPNRYPGGGSTEPPPRLLRRPRRIFASSEHQWSFSAQHSHSDCLAGLSTAGESAASERTTPNENDRRV